MPQDNSKTTDRSKDFIKPGAIISYILATLMSVGVYVFNEKDDELKRLQKEVSDMKETYRFMNITPDKASELMRTLGGSEARMINLEEGLKDLKQNMTKTHDRYDEDMRDLQRRIRRCEK